MAYFICFLYSISLVCVTYKKSCDKNIFIFLSISFVLLWSLLIGLQDNVGTDYKAYYQLFSSNSGHRVYFNKKEFFFYHLAEFIVNYRLNPQVGFIIIAFIQFLFLFLFLKKVSLDCFFVFVFCFFCVSTAFPNQTNGIRQYTAVYIILLSSIYCYEKKPVKFLLLVTAAALFHISALIFLVFYPIRKVVQNLGRKQMMIILAVATVISLINSNAVFVYVIQKFFAHSPYRVYITSSFMTDLSKSGLTIVTRLTKYIYIPFYLLSLMSLKGFNMSLKDKYLYNAGFLFFCLKIASLNNFFMLRFSFYYEILLIFPIYFYIVYLLKHKSYKTIFLSGCILLFFVGFFGVKTLAAPKLEYDYKSVLTRDFRGE